MTIDVILVDDHTLVRQAVAQLLDAAEDIRVVGQAGSMREAAAVLPQTPAHVIVVDVSLPDGNGLALARLIRAKSTSMGIVVLTMHEDAAVLLAARDAGASALVLKSEASEALSGAVRHAHQQPGEFVAAHLAAAVAEGRNSLLSARESEVLQLLYDGASVAGVAAALHVSEATVKTHISRLYGKLAVHNRAAAVREAIRLGLVGSSGG